jgi:Helix-turn-helix domain
VSWNLVAAIDAVRDAHGLTTVQKAVAWALVSRADKTGRCFPSFTTIAKDAACSRAATAAAIGCLLEHGAGCLRVTKSKGKKSNTYTLRLVQELDGSNSDPVQEMDPTRPGDGRDPSRRWTPPVQEMDPKEPMKEPTKEPPKVRARGAVGGVASDSSSGSASWRTPELLRAAAAKNLDVDAMARDVMATAKAKGEPIRNLGAVLRYRVDKASVQAKPAYAKPDDEQTLLREARTDVARLLGIEASQLTARRLEHEATKRRISTDCPERELLRAIGGAIANEQVAANLGGVMAALGKGGIAKADPDENQATQSA